MCNFFSLILMQDGRTFWLAESDNHSDIIDHFHLEDKETETDKLEFARVEILPPETQHGGDDVFAPLDKWSFKIDEAITPTWFNEAYREICFDALREYMKGHIINLKDADDFETVGNMKVRADNTNVFARDGAYVEAFRGSNITAYGSNIIAQIGSRVFAYRGSTVEAYADSTVWALEGSDVDAYKDSHVIAQDGAEVSAYDGSNVTAEEGSQVIAHRGAVVNAHGFSRVTAQAGSRIEAGTHSIIYADSQAHLDYIAPAAVIFFMHSQKIIIGKNVGKSETHKVMRQNIFNPSKEKRAEVAAAIANKNRQHITRKGTHRPRARFGAMHPTSHTHNTKG